MKPYSHARTAELITRRVHWKPGNPPSETDILVADLSAQLEAADERIAKQKARIIKLNREEEDE